ncbi:hypothetical protein ETB97_012185 [Aspergillus alliaceus]|uniref:Uncharacterized protein n=1 Tax=Petromyces alliaceus TaxID=209559 RepID=A0A8H6A8B1_PETAA|nr:hypothetical protein ETB97_012185 [Aspergillus burnettii]
MGRRNRRRSTKSAPQKGQADISEAQVLELTMLGNNMFAILQRLAQARPHYRYDLKEMIIYDPALLDEILDGPRLDVIPLDRLPVRFESGRLVPQPGDEGRIKETLDSLSRDQVQKFGQFIRWVESAMDSFLAA